MSSLKFLNSCWENITEKENKAKQPILISLHQNLIEQKGSRIQRFIGKQTLIIGAEVGTTYIPVFLATKQKKEKALTLSEQMWKTDHSLSTPKQSFPGLQLAQNLSVNTNLCCSYAQHHALPEPLQSPPYLHSQPAYSQSQKGCFSPRIRLLHHFVDQELSSPVDYLFWVLLLHLWVAIGSPHKSHFLDQRQLANPTVRMSWRKWRRQVWKNWVVNEIWNDYGNGSEFIELWRAGDMAVSVGYRGEVIWVMKQCMCTNVWLKNNVEETDSELA